MTRARLLKKTCHFLWRDISEITREIVVPGLLWLVVILVGLIFSVAIGYPLSVLFGVTEEHQELGLAFVIGAGFLYYGICHWLYSAYEKAQKAIYNENKELVDNIKDPK